nr:EOG090X03YR [Chydorus sphaericus]
MESHRLKQHQLIEQLKQQLEDLERYAYETGEAGLPQTQVVERQKIIIDQMKSKLQFNVDDLDKYTVEELRQQVDQAIGQLVNPLKMKEQLVSQLKTQITDLERFIEFLQGPAETQQEHCRNCAKTGKHPFCKPSSSRVGGDKGSGKPLQLNEKNVTYISINKLLFRLIQIFKKSRIKDALSRLNGAVLHVMRSASNHDNSPASSKTALVGATWQPDVQIEIVKAVRKGLCPALRDLLSHGMLNQGSTSLVPFFSCAVPRSAGIPAAASSSAGCSPPHPWQIFVAFYTTKDGKSVMSNPQRSLAQSFSLEIQGGTSKQGLLMAIGNIIAMHRPYKRGPEAHFKAFLSSALNAKKIVPWLRIILRSPSLLDEFYEPWAFAVQPGFDDIWRVLEPLQSVNFQLPEDLSIRSLRNISDAF